MSTENPTPHDLRIIASNLKAEGQISRAEFLFNLSFEFARLQRIEEVAQKVTERQSKMYYSEDYWIIGEELDNLAAALEGKQ